MKAQGEHDPELAHVGRRGAGRGETQGTRRIKSRQKSQVIKMAGLYREGNWGESSPAPPGLKDLG